MSTKIIMIKENYFKDGNRWTMYKTEAENVTPEQVERIADSMKFFRRIGGKETLEKNYTCLGYKPTKLTSISPDKTAKTVRKFEYQYNEI